MCAHCSTTLATRATQEKLPIRSRMLERRFRAGVAAARPRRDLLPAGFPWGPPSRRPKVPYRQRHPLARGVQRRMQPHPLDSVPVAELPLRQRRPAVVAGPASEARAQAKRCAGGHAAVEGGERQRDVHDGHLRRAADVVRLGDKGFRRERARRGAPVVLPGGSICLAVTAGRDVRNGQAVGS